MSAVMRVREAGRQAPLFLCRYRLRQFYDILAGNGGLMSNIQAFLLGLLQGIAEFLPISSSGHLAVAKELFSLSDIPLLFDILLHLATLAAVVVFFRKKIAALFGVLFRWIRRRPLPDDKAGQSMIIALVLGTAVTGVIGIAASDFVEDIPVVCICGGFIVTALILILSSYLSARRAAPPSAAAGTVTPVQGLLVGLAQGVGVLPGISRSGSTIAGALFAGVDRNTAGEFSFLLSIPAILGAFILELKDIGDIAGAVGVLPLAIGCATAFASGLFALAVLMKLIRRGNLAWFAVYLIPAGIAGIMFL